MVIERMNFQRSLSVQAFRYWPSIFYIQILGKAVCFCIYTMREVSVVERICAHRHNNTHTLHTTQNEELKTHQPRRGRNPSTRLYQLAPCRGRHECLSSRCCVFDIPHPHTNRGDLLGKYKSLLTGLQGITFINPRSSQVSLA